MSIASSSGTTASVFLAISCASSRLRSVVSSLQKLQHSSHVERPTWFIGRWKSRPRQPKRKPTESYRVTLRQNLVAAFNDSELRDLCFDMNVDYESLNGENKADKARELIAFCERRQSVPDLVARCQELRPNTSWEEEYELAQDLLLSKPKSV